MRERNERITSIENEVESTIHKRYQVEERKREKSRRVTGEEEKSKNGEGKKEMNLEMRRIGKENKRRKE